MADDAVKIPISFEVTDLNLDSVDPKDIEQGLQSKLKGLRKAFEDTMKSIDTSSMSKEFDTMTNDLKKSFQSVREEARAFNKMLKDDSGKTSMEQLEAQAEKVAKSFSDLGTAYNAWNKVAGEESMLTQEFRNELTVLKELMTAFDSYKKGLENVVNKGENSGEAFEMWSVYTKSAEANIKAILNDMSALVKSGEAFKLGSNTDENYDTIMSMIKSLRGSVQTRANSANALIGGAELPEELLQARTRVDELDQSLKIAQSNLNSLLNAPNVDASAVETMNNVVTNLTAQLTQAEAAYENIRLIGWKKNQRIIR